MLAGIPTWVPSAAIALCGLALSIVMARRQVTAKWLAEHDERQQLLRAVSDLHGIPARVSQVEALCNQRNVVTEKDLDAINKVTAVQLAGIRESITNLSGRLGELVQRISK